jgi:hypothetical protein
MTDHSNNLLRSFLIRVEDVRIDSLAEGNGFIVEGSDGNILYGTVGPETGNVNWFSILLEDRPSSGRSDIDDCC